MRACWLPEWNWVSQLLGDLVLILVGHTVKDIPACGEDSLYLGCLPIGWLMICLFWYTPKGAGIGAEIASHPEGNKLCQYLCSPASWSNVYLEQRHPRAKVRTVLFFNLWIIIYSPDWQAHFSRSNNFATVLIYNSNKIWTCSRNVAPHIIRNIIFHLSTSRVYQSLSARIDWGYKNTNMFSMEFLIFVFKINKN